MSTNSKIEWTGATWNPVTGCTHVAGDPACDHCYAVPMTHRLEMMGQSKYAGLTVLNARGDRHFNGEVRTHEDALEIPLKRAKPTTYFVNSMSDLFHKEVHTYFIQKVFFRIKACPQHTFQILTKRPELMAEELHRWAHGCGHGVLPNAWFGTSIGTRKFLHRIDTIRDIPAAVRFLSLEPLLEDLGPLDLRGIHWVIVGGESGPGARPCQIEWIRDIVKQCKEVAVPCFVKQIGARPRLGTHDYDTIDGDAKGGTMHTWPADLCVREFPKAGAA